MSGSEESASQGQPTRCSLVSTSTLARATYSEAKAFNIGNFNPSLAIDIDEETISVVDLDTNAPVVSAPLAQVTATPAKDERKYPRLGVMALPVLVVCVPGVQRLTIGCMDAPTRFAQLGYRYSWRDTVPQEKDPAYFASGADWLTLVKTFGLTPQLQDSHPAGPPPWYQQPRGQRLLRWIVIGWLIVVAAAVVVVPLLALIFHR